MTSLPQIQQAIAELSPQDFATLSQWLGEHRQRRWDEQIAHDAKSGALDFLAAELDTHLAKGEARHPHPTT